MLPALTVGATGRVDGPLSLIPELWVAIWNAYQDGDMERAAAAQSTATETLELLSSCGGGFHALGKAALGLRLGIDCGQPGLPGSPRTDDQWAALRRTLDRLELAL